MWVFFVSLLSVSLLWIFFDIFLMLLHLLSLFCFPRGEGGGKVLFEGASDKVVPSCLCFLVLLSLPAALVMPAIARFLLLLQLPQVFGLEGAQQRVSKLPVVLTVLIDQTHLWLAQNGQQVLVLACIGVQRRQPPAAIYQRVVDGPTRQHHQLQLDQRVFKVLLCGCALVQAGVRELQRAQEEPLVRLQNPTIRAHLQRHKQLMRKQEPFRQIRRDATLSSLRLLSLNKNLCEIFGFVVLWK